MYDNRKKLSIAEKEGNSFYNPNTSSSTLQYGNYTLLIFEKKLFAESIFIKTMQKHCMIFTTFNFKMKQD